MPKKKLISTQQNLDSEIKSICDIMRGSNCSGAMQYIPVLTYLLFLKILDDIEKQKHKESEYLGTAYIPAISEPFRWRDWGNKNGKKRAELTCGSTGVYFKFLNAELFPYLKELKNKTGATSTQIVISEIMSNVERVVIDSEKIFLDICDKIDNISNDNIDSTHIFTLSQVYEGLLLKMGEKNSDGGQFFTPREVIRAMVLAIDPKIGETIYDPCCGTGGFLVQAFLHILENVKNHAEHLKSLKNNTLFGKEKDNVIYPITLANMILHGIEHPAICHGNTLSGLNSYEGLFTKAPKFYDVILTNVPFGSKENEDAKVNFNFKTSNVKILFLQYIIDALKQGGRCAMVIDEGALFVTTENAFVNTKQKLLSECNVFCIVSLPQGLFTNAGSGGIKTNILFFEKGQPTEKIWYYDLSDIKVGKRKPFTLDRFDDFFKLLPSRADSDRSWSIDIETIIKNNYDIKADNPNKQTTEITTTPEELIALIEEKQKEIEETIALLKRG